MLTVDGQIPKNYSDNMIDSEVSRWELLTKKKKKSAGNATIIGAVSEINEPKKFLPNLPRSLSHKYALNRHEYIFLPLVC